MSSEQADGFTEVNWCRACGKPDRLELNFYRLQYEVGQWSRKNFPNNTPDNPFMGVVEEVGELAHALLKKNQGIRGTAEEHDAAAKDAVGDIVVYMADFCERRGWDFQDIIEKVWNHVKQRDWTKNKQTGVTA